MRRIFLLVGAVAVLGALVAATVVLAQTRGDLSDARARIGRLSSSLQSERERRHVIRVDTARGLHEIKRRLRREHSDAQEWKGATKAAEAFRREIFAVLHQMGMDIARGECKGSAIGSILPGVLSPRPQEIVSNPVVAHVIGAKPLFCDPTFYVTVDGVPYEQFPSAKPGLPGARNPDVMRARPDAPKQRWTDFCISGSYDYLRFTLPPGPHTLRINGGCPQGTDVPATIPVQVTFSVHRP